MYRFTSLRKSFLFVTVPSLSCVWLCDPMDYRVPGFPVLHHLMEFAQTHVHRVTDGIQPSHLLYPLLLLPSILPSIGVFSNESALCISQSTGASASVLPMNIQDWFPLGFIGLISLVSKGLSRVFSSTTIQKQHSSSFSLLHGSTLTSVHDYWKNHSFDYTDICQ